MLAELLNVISVQRHCFDDGSGVRTTVFLKGCYLHCPWCCNPESISTKDEFFFDRSKCLFLGGIESKLCLDCILKGGDKKREFCLVRACYPVSKKMSDDNLLHLLFRDEELYKRSNGGVTFSGGEPFMQATELLPILIQLRNRDIHITFETSCFFPSEKMDLLLPYIDSFIVDLKFQYGFIKNREVSISSSNFERNLFQIQSSNKKIHYRMVFIESAFRNNEDVDALIQKLKEFHITSLELLPSHNFAKSKYLFLNMANQDYSEKNKTHRMSVMKYINENSSVIVNTID